MPTIQSSADIIAMHVCSCKTVILNAITTRGTQSLKELRDQCTTMAVDYSVENFNAALNDLMKDYHIMQVGVDMYDLC